MATPLIQSKTGQILVFSGPVSNVLTGAAVTAPVADDWENDQAYLKSELVKITANSTDYTLRCIEAYTSSSSATLTGSVAAGVLTLSGTDASRWEPVAGPGAMFRGTAFTWSESRTTTEEDFLEDEGTETSVSGIPLTGSYTFAVRSRQRMAPHRLERFQRVQLPHLRGWSRGRRKVQIRPMPDRSFRRKDQQQGERHLGLHFPRKRNEKESDGQRHHRNRVAWAIPF